MNKWLNKAFAAAGEAGAESAAQDISRTNSADSADSPLTALTTLSVPIGPLNKQADRTSPETTTAPVAARREWAAAAAQLQQLDCPATVSEERWQQVRADAERLLDWAPMLVAMEWTTQDVFGRDDIDRQSLAWKMQGQRIGPVTTLAVTLRGADGSTTWVYRRTEK